MAASKSHPNKRQRLSEDGASAVTAADPAEQTITAEPTANDEEISKKQLQQRRSLFVRSLAATTTTEDLTEHFSQSYPIKHALAVLDPATKQCKGYGFVTFADAEDAQRAKDEFNGSEIQGRKIRVEVAEPRHRDVDSEIPGHKKSIPSAKSLEIKAAREQQKQEPPPKLIIRNLPWSIKTPDDLALLFRSYGKVKHATLPKTAKGLKGFGFVLLRGRKNAEKALEGINGKEIDGRTLAVDWAVEKEQWHQLQENEQADAEEGSTVEGTSDESSEVSDASESEEEEDSEAEDEDFEDVSDDEDGGVALSRSTANPTTIFVRNLPFQTEDDDLREHFEQFGPVRYARVVHDPATERSRGSGFVCFVKEDDMIECLKGVPRTRVQTTTSDRKDGTSVTVNRSILEDDEADPTGRYKIDGRILHITKAVDRGEAAQLTRQGHESRFNRDKDKRRLYLLSEGTIARGSALYEKLSPSEVAMREQSAKQRRQLIESNPALHISLTRLSIRNIPRNITSKTLKELARKAVVGFASDVKANKRQKLSKEEVSRGGDAMKLAEKIRKKRGKGIVKQAKVVFETPEGSKVTEDSGAGRSRGYGFIEYYTHRAALMGLRWLNGHAVEYQVKGEAPKGKRAAQEAFEDRKKRLIVEFAIENANVVQRRSEREAKPREQHSKLDGATTASEAGASRGNKKRKRSDSDAASHGPQRKRGKGAQAVAGSAKNDTKGKKGQGTGAAPGSEAGGDTDKNDKLAKRSRIIQKKRMAKRARRAGKA